MKAAVLRSVGQSATVEELALRSVARHEVMVTLAAGGVCHTDLSVRDGLMPALLPCTLGHEGAGIVTEVGADVSTVDAGDHVVLTWNVPCRSCPDCLRGDSQLCPRGDAGRTDAAARRCGRQGGFLTSARPRRPAGLRSWRPRRPTARPTR
jgi:S-(hydroxymethyl)glutathione dehydrogenase/alcohol dehydrogenase